MADLPKRSGATGWMIAAVLLHWTVVATVAIYCFIVFVMKGPAYVADRYELPDEDAPR